ncbi:efflux transporter outer membrane subunit [Sphingomonas sp. GlSt437]|uniref:efflux transporter outer membrane subunit n=1 Tax=Sphingomonas sp. GlSt437 TaxID=3389970 RepID=UPI003A84ED4F
MTRGLLIAVLAAALPLTGCVVGPNYHRPQEPASASGSLKEAGGAGSSSATAAGLDQWWRMYNDPVLDRLVREALTNNTDIRVAAANLAKARAVLSAQRGARLPTTNVSAQYQREQSNSASAAAFGGGGGNVQTFQFDLFQLGFDASYEVDLFGGVTRAIQAARGDTEAAAAELDASRVSVAAETARAYFSACSNAAQLAVAKDNVDLQQKTLDLTNKLFTAGRETKADYERADSLLAQAQAQVPGFEAEQRASLYALATLTGRPPEEVDADASRCTAPPRLSQPVPAGDGAALIARRPDVRAAERTLAADTARVGVAIADLYPKITLMGNVNAYGTRGSQLFQPSAVRYSFGPLISWTFPNQTQARARVREARADADASLAKFDKAVLTALTDSEQALARYSGQLDRNAVLLRAESASSEAARLSRLRFDAGSDSFLQLISAESTRVGARAARAASDAALADAQISVFKALGGGWEGAPKPERLAPDHAKDGAADSPAKP